MAEIGLTEQRAIAKRELKVLVEHFLYSQKGLYQVASEAYAEWDAEQSQDGDDTLRQVEP